MKRNLFIILLFMSQITLADVQPDTQIMLNQIHAEHVVWNRTPIEFVVPVGQERLLSFPGSVSFHNTNSNLTSDKVSVLNNAGTLYIRAKKAFDPIRVPIVLK